MVAESDAAAVAVEVSEDGTELTLTGVSAGEATITVTATDDSEADNAISEPVEFAVVSNTAPTAEDDMASTGDFTAVEINVLANDADPDGQPLTVESASNGAHGTTAISGNAITYMARLGIPGHRHLRLHRHRRRRHGRSKGLGLGRRLAGQSQPELHRELPGLVGAGAGPRPHARALGNDGRRGRAGLFRRRWLEAVQPSARRNVHLPSQALRRGGRVPGHARAASGRDCHVLAGVGYRGIERDRQHALRDGASPRAETAISTCRWCRCRG